MTEDQRTISPIIIPEKQMIYAIKTYDGTSNIVASSLDTIIFKPVTKYDNGIQILSLSYDSDNVPPTPARATLKESLLTTIALYWDVVTNPLITVPVVS